MTSRVRCFLVIIILLLVSMVSIKPAVAATPLTFTEFQLSEGFEIGDMVDGPDGNVWFTLTKRTIENGSSTYTQKIAKITPSGQITEFPVENVTFLVAGHDGNVWFAANALSSIGKITPSGSITLYQAPSEYDSFRGLAKGPDGNIWFTMRGGHIGRITSAGTYLTRFALNGEIYPTSIAAGSDGAMWFAQPNSKRIGRITMDGLVTDYTVAGAIWDTIVKGSDGNIWFSERIDLESGLSDYKLGKITPQGQVFEYAQENYGGSELTTGSDGNIWFTHGNFIGRITTTGVTTLFPTGVCHWSTSRVTAGPDGNIWFGYQNSNDTIYSKITRASIAGVSDLTPAEYTCNIVPSPSPSPSPTPTPTPTPSPLPTPTPIPTSTPKLVTTLKGIAVDHQQIPLDRIDISVTCKNTTRKTTTDRQGRFRRAIGSNANCRVGDTATVTAIRNGVTGVGTAIVQTGGELGSVTIPLMTDMELKAIAAIDWATQQMQTDQSSDKNNFFKKCLLFVQKAWEAAGISLGRGGNPVKYWDNYPAHFTRHSWTAGDTTIPPKGALVIWGKTQWSSEGHVALSTGDGNVISTWAVPYAGGDKQNHSIFTFSIYNSTRNPQTYNLLGWIMPQ